ncbi:MAG TPA: GNAT family N-acetyltransferase [Rhodanobacter sp.]
MRKLPVIRVVPMDASLRPMLFDLHVSPSQSEYVGTIADMLADVAASPGSEAMAILHGEVPVGCYRLDPHARSVAGHDFGQPALGVRAFFVDARWQRRGVGTAALIALIADAAERHPHARLLALTVSVDNTVALQMYRRAGFTDGGELYHGGRSGPLHLLLRTLP